MSRMVFRLLLLAACAAAVLTAQPAPMQRGAGVPAGYRTLSDASADTRSLSTPVTVSARQRTLGSLLREIARQSRVSFAADLAQPGMDMLRDLDVVAMPARDAIQQLVQGTAFHALVSPAGEVVIARRPAASARDDFAAQGPKVRVSGYVRSVASAEVIRRARLSVDDEAVRGESNDDGFYSLLLPQGSHRVRIRAIGYAPFDTTIAVVASLSHDFLLQTRNVTLAAVTVQADAKGDRPDLDPRTPDMSVVRLDLAAVKLLPTVLGEPDPIRSLTLLPGVSLSSDASTGFSVRGGAADQNLFLLDEATVYNPSHILGFLSTFNADAVDNVTLYKGAIPSKFGGRLSSVVDVRQREGNANEFAGNLSLGLLAGHGTLEGPLPGKVGSYMFAARRSWADVFTGLSSDTSIRNTSAYFYDINAKTNVRLGASGAVLLSGYLGRDRLAGPTGVGAAGWGNRALTLRWNQAVGGRLFSKVTTAWGEYDYRLDIVTGTRDSISWKSRIASLNVKVDETLYLSPTNTIEFGVEVTGQHIKPGDLLPIGPDNAYAARSIQRRTTVMPAAWIGQEIQMGPRVSVRYGLRYAGYERLGPATLYDYENDAPVVYSPALGRYEPGTVRDSTRVASGHRIASAGGLEPRLSGRLMLSDMTSLKASYARAATMPATWPARSARPVPAAWNASSAANPHASAAPHT
jgi:hypothetical protein